MMILLLRLFLTFHLRLNLSSPADNSWTNDDTPTLFWNASSDLESGLAKYQLYIDGALNKDNINSSNISTTPTSNLSDGSYTWYVKAFDNSGNERQSTSTWTIKIDTVGPAGSISNGSGNPANDLTPILNLSISDSGVGTADSQMRFSCDNSNWSNWENYAAPKTNFNVRTGAGCVDADGNKIVYVQFKDSLGNENGLSYNTGSFVLDTASSFATFASGAPANPTNQNSADITVAGTDITHYKYKLDSGSYGNETAISSHLVLSDLDDGERTLYLIGKDTAVNWQAEVSATEHTWLIDTIAPLSVGVPSFGTITAASIEIIKPAVVTENGSGLYQWQVRKNSITELDFNSNSANSITNSSLLENTQYTYDAQFKDNANNTGNYGTSASKYTLANAPTNLTATATVIEIDLLVDNFSNNTAGLSGYYFENTTNGTNSDWIQTNSWNDANLPCGTEYVYTVKYRNGDGIETDTISLTESTDNCGGHSGGSLPQDAYSPPAMPNPSDDNPKGGFNIIINNGLKQTNNQTIELKLFGGIDSKKMIISENSDFKNAIQEPYQKTKQWTLSNGDGLKTIYVKFYTQWGVESKIISDSIVLDAIAPIIKVSNIQKIYQDNQNIIISGTTEPSAVVAPKLNGEYFGIASADKNGNWSLDLGRFAIGDFKLELKAEDQAGNIGETLVLNFKVIAFQEEDKLDEPLEFNKPIKLVEKQKEPSETEKPSEIKNPEPEEAPSIINKISDILKPEKKPKSKEEFQPTSYSFNFLSQALQDITNKFSPIKETFVKLKIRTYQDLERLNNVKLTLPSIKEIIRLNKLESEKISFQKPIKKEIKDIIPDDSLFFTAIQDKIHINTSITSLNEKKPIQEISIPSGQNIKIIIKPSKPVKTIKAQLVLKQRDLKTPAFAPAGATAWQAKLNFSDLFISSAIAKEIETRFAVIEFDFIDPDNDGIYTAEIQAPLVAGEYEIITTLDYQDPKTQDKELRIITLIDPEGYVYEKNQDGSETRIKNAEVSLYQLNQKTNKYELWKANEFQQKNPQITRHTGEYSFLVPEGTYYLKAEAENYTTSECRRIESEKYYLPNISQLVKIIKITISLILSIF